MVRTSVGVVAAVAGSAVGQVDGHATWLWEVVTEDGDALVEPGETATVTMSIDMSPDVSFPEGPVLAFGGAFFDTLGGPNADRGGIQSWQVLNFLDQATGDKTTTDGVNLFGTDALQLLTDGFVTDDPIDVFGFMWGTDDHSGYTVEYATETAGGIQDNPPHAVGV